MGKQPLSSVAADDCEVVKWHTRQKHEFIRQYLAVWTERVAKRGRSAPKLSVVDLFAAYGWCRANPETEHGAPLEPWPGTAVLGARALKEYPRPARLVLNSYDPTSESTSAVQLGALRRAIDSELAGQRKFPVSFFSEGVEAAVREAGNTVDLNYPSIWILDPYYPESLPWSVVESIANLKREYRTKTGSTSRRPELIVTLITEGLQRNIDLSPRSVDLALGLATEVWRAKLKELQSERANTRQALTYIFAERLHDLYGKWPTVLEVDASQGNIVYTLILCSSHDAGTFVPKILVKPEFQAWRLSTWKPTARLITMNRLARRKGGVKAPIQRSLEQSVSDGP